MKEELKLKRREQTDNQDKCAIKSFETEDEFFILTN